MQLQQTQLIKLNRLRLNEGQIEGLPKNPRFIKDVKFKKLVESIRNNPEMLPLRECLVYYHDRKYVILAGNMRFRAMQELGYAEAPCKIIAKGTPIEKLKAIVMLDNAAFGELDWDIIANEWTDDVDQLSGWGVDVPNWFKEAQEETENEASGYDQQNSWNLVIKLDSEKKAQEMYEHLNGQGYEVKIVT
jgi:hypothetical protein